jgi:hypothetical protein
MARSPCKHLRASKGAFSACTCRLIRCRTRPRITSPAQPAVPGGVCRALGRSRIAVIVPRRRQRKQPPPIFRPMRRSCPLLGIASVSPLPGHTSQNTATAPRSNGEPPDDLADHRYLARGSRGDCTRLTGIDGPSRACEFRLVAEPLAAEHCVRQGGVGSTPRPCPRRLVRSLQAGEMRRHSGR